MLRKSFPFVLIVVGAASAVMGQSKPEMTARELFFVPAEVTTSSKSTPPVTKATPKAPQVAAKGQSTPKANPTVPKETYTDTEVKLVTATYQGPRPLGLKYRLLQQSGSSWKPVNVNKAFRAGDAIRVNVESNERGHLYVVTRGSSGVWSVLFPTKSVRDGDNFIEAGDKMDLPSPKQKWTFDEKSGEEKIFLVLSRKPVADLDRLIYDLNESGKTPAKSSEPKAGRKESAPAAAPKASGEPKQAPVPPARPTMLASNIRPIDDQLVGRLRSQMLSRDLVLEQVEDKGGSSSGNERLEPAAYVVEKSGKPDARLVVDISLKHD